MHVDAERGFGGGEVQVFLLLAGLARRGHRSVLVCPPGSRAEGEARRRGVEAWPLPMRGDLDLPAVLALRSALGACHADLVHLHTGRAAWLGGLAARLAGLPSLTTRRMDRPVKRNWRSRLLYGHLVRRAVAISPAVERRLREARVACPVTTIPSAVDPELLRPARPRDEVRAELGLAPEARVLLVLAALVRRKGIDVLLEALALLGDGPAAPALLVAGAGPERAALEELARARGLAARVRFLGQREDKAELLHACDVFCLPSRLEGLGVAALEAMACGRPVLATRVGGLAEAVVDGRTGLVVEPEAPAALAAALARLLADPALCRRLGEEGPRRVAEGFLAEQMTAAYEALYREILAGEAA